MFNKAQVITWLTLILTSATAGVAEKFGFDQSTWNKEMAEAALQLVTLGMAVYTHVYHGANSTTSTPSSSGGKAAALLIFLGLSLGVGSLSGCASSQTAVAYKGEAATDTAVTAAMTLWGSYVASGHSNTNQELAVRQAFNAYQQSELFAIDTTSAFVTNGVTVNVESNALQNVSAAINDLLSLTSQFETVTN